MCSKNKRYDPVVRCCRSTTALVANGNSRRRMTICIEMARTEISLQTRKPEVLFSRTENKSFLFRAKMIHALFICGFFLKNDLRVCDVVGR